MAKLEKNTSEVLSSNAIWLTENFESHNRIADGVAEDMAEYVVKLFGGEVPEPSEALERLTETIAEEDALCLFPRFSKVIVRLSHKNDALTTFSPTLTAYMKSPAADAAFNAFDKKYPSIKAVNGISFKEMCEDLFYDRIDACILPLDSSDEGLIMSFRHMTLKYELSIVSVCRVWSEEAFTSFALLTSGSKANGEYSEYFFSSLSKSEHKLLLKAANELDGDILRMNSFEISAAGESEVHIQVSFNGENRAAFKYCIDALFPAGVHLGDYEILFTDINN